MAERVVRTGVFRFLPSPIRSINRAERVVRTGVFRFEWAEMQSGRGFRLADALNPIATAVFTFHPYPLPTYLTPFFNLVLP